MTLSIDLYVSEQGANLVVEDEASGLRILQANISPEQFTSMLGRRMGVKIDDAVLYKTNFPHLGKTREIKKVALEKWSFGYPKPDQVRERVKPHLVDGWELYHDGTGQQQNNPDGYEVTLIRFVEKSS